MLEVRVYRVMVAARILWAAGGEHRPVAAIARMKLDRRLGSASGSDVVPADVWAFDAEAADTVGAGCGADGVALAAAAAS